MLTAAFASLSRRAPQLGQSHSRMFNGLGLSLTWHTQQVCVLAYQRLILRMSRPASRPIWVTSRMRVPHPASSTLLPSRVLARPVMESVSRAIAWFSSMSLLAVFVR